MENSPKKFPFRVFVTERRCSVIDVLAENAWAAKAYAEEHPGEWINVDAEATVEQVLLYDKPDFRATECA